MSLDLPTPRGCVLSTPAIVALAFCGFIAILVLGLMAGINPVGRRQGVGSCPPRSRRPGSCPSVEACDGDEPIGTASIEVDFTAAS